MGDYLLEKGLVSGDDLEIALAYQQEKLAEGEPVLIGQALIELGLIDRPSLDETITEQILQLQLALRKANQELEQRVEERTADLQQALSKLTELNQLKTNFVSNISHELRTPLTHIKGYLDLLADGTLGPLAPQQTDAVQVLVKSERRLELLIDDLIQFSLIARGEFQLKLESIDLHDAVEVAVQQSSPKAGTKSIALHRSMADDLPRVEADKAKIVWVLIQLIDNAIKFTQEGGSVRVTASSDKNEVALTVEDTGIGIPPERIPEIFEPFHQLDGAHTRRYSGTGLGLALVRRIIEAHGTMIAVDSSVGQGSSFKFTLPANQ
ncbi:MAG TPA: HAMP domain-containing sensor histidine kinase [Anaerolineales bacterium]|nr:HAMP domain-containing sensor histidine kinase [Anaerolineales bacterium]